MTPPAETAIARLADLAGGPLAARSPKPRSYPKTLGNPGVPDGGVNPAALQSSSPGVIAGAAASLGGLAKAGLVKSK